MSDFDVKLLLDQLNDQLDKEMEKIEPFDDYFVIKTDSNRHRRSVINAPTTMSDHTPYDCGDASSLIDIASSRADQHNTSQYSDRSNVTSRYRRGSASLTAHNGLVPLHRYNGDCQPRNLTSKKSKAIDIIDPATGEKIV